MKKLILIFLLVSTSLTGMWAQDGQYDIRLTLDNIDYVDNTISVLLEVKASGPTTHFSLSDQNYRFSFNEAALANPQVQTAYLNGLVQTTNPSSTSFFSGGNLNGSVDSIISYNVVLNGGPGYPLDDLTWVEIALLKFDIVNIGVCADFKWYDQATFPPTFIGEKANNVLLQTDEGAYTDLSHCFAAQANDDEYFMTSNTISGSVIANDHFLRTPTITVQTNPTKGNVTMDAAGNFIYTPNSSYNGSDSFAYEVCNTAAPIGCATGIVTIKSVNPILNAKMVLQGPYDDATGLMDDVLRTQGVIPTQEPYSQSNKFHFPDPTMAGMQITDNTVLNMTGPQAIVDWVFLEIRDKNDPTILITSRPALMTREGNIVDVDGVSTLELSGIAGGQYYVVFRHRNHLAAMTIAPVTLDENGILIDFTAQNSYVGTAGWGQAEIEPGVFGLYAGDYDQDYDITGQDNSIWSQENGTFEMYLQGDGDMNADVNGVDKIHWSTNNGVFSWVPK